MGENESGRLIISYTNTSEANNVARLTIASIVLTLEKYYNQEAVDEIRGKPKKEEDRQADELSSDSEDEKKPDIKHKKIPSVRNVSVNKLMWNGSETSLVEYYNKNNKKFSGVESMSPGPDDTLVIGFDNKHRDEAQRTTKSIKRILLGDFTEGIVKKIIPGSSLD